MGDRRQTLIELGGEDGLRLDQLIAEFFGHSAIRDLTLVDFQSVAPMWLTDAFRPMSCKLQAIMRRRVAARVG
ncbi:hypothetical protein A9K72_34450 [Mesorhizobium loti]|nr:hypothetical protein A9174_32020 [Mesorhizobium loti NZP2037]OBP78120.1 hypothetical protein BAE41_30720 [Mesorhizobium loti]OBP92836.1 hypothetical protein BAE38_30665 [Mesorhizobium loti]OBQ66509.1 hypothetical protein A9K72_34450 [Mesorhizobium loti]